MLAKPGFQRRRLSLTPLIDVIFLLLLFFMLSSTFSKFGEVELTQSGRGGVSATERPGFVQLGAERLALNGTPIDLGALSEALKAGLVLVSLDADTSSQRLVDVLATLRTRQDLSVTVLN